MKENFIHVCFVIDSSGSMCGSEADVIGGFKRVVDEQKANENGSCVVSVIDFNSYPEIICVGKDVHDVDSELNYTVGGGTALFDAIALGIQKTHDYNMSLDNAERPEKTMVVIMTDGGENYSRHFSGSAVRDKIKEMETEFGWSFVYLGADLTNVNDADTLGIKTRGVSTKSMMGSNYDTINSTVNVFRCAKGTTEMKYATMDSVLENSVEALNTAYETSTGVKIK
jgi:uncharacterized protein YegL